MNPWECDGCKWCYVRKSKIWSDHNERFCMWKKLHPNPKLIQQYGFNPKFGRIVNIRRIKHCKHKTK